MVKKLARCVSYFHSFCFMMHVAEQRYAPTASSFDSFGWRDGHRYITRQPGPGEKIPCLRHDDLKRATPYEGTAILVQYCHLTLFGLSWVSKPLL
jgi:hypothetical protein